MLPTIICTVMKLIPGDEWGVTCSFNTLERAKLYLKSQCTTVSEDGWEGESVEGIKYMIEENCLEPTDWEEDLDDLYPLT
jgi:hypothetical protein